MNIKYILFIVSMVICTFAVPYFGEHIPLIVVEPAFFIAPNAWSLNPLFVALFFFLIAQLCFFALAHRRFYRSNRAVKIILTVAFVYIAVCIELAQFFGTGLSFKEMMQFPLILNPLSTVPMLVTAIVYFVDIWKPMPESNAHNSAVL